MYAILGTGISSLILAHLLIRRGVPGKKIVIIEPSKESGGLFGYIKHDENTKFDIGMHTIQLTGSKEIDDILISVIEENDWCKFHPPRHDLSGVILGNQLFENGPYFNLEFFNDAKYEEISRGLQSHLGNAQTDRKPQEKNSSIHNSANAQTYLQKKFGRAVADETYIRALQMRYGFEADKLDVIATQLTPMDRILASKQFRDEELLNNENLRQTIAWSDQRTLPLSFSSQRPVFYPRRGSIHILIENLIDPLKRQSVNFEFNTKIDQIEINKNFINGLRLSKSGESIRIEITKLFWAGNTTNLLKLIGVRDQPIKFENPLKTCVVTIKVDRENIKKSDCMYFFNYLNKTGLYRLNNYDAYVGTVQDEKQAKLSLEYIVGKEVKLESQQIIQHLAQFDFLDSNTEKISLRVHELPYGHPLPVLSNVQSEAFQMESLHERDISNLSCFGLSLAKRRFFQKEVLIHLMEVIKNV